MAFEWIIDALEQTWSAIEMTLRDRSDVVFDAPTPCPGWTIRDIVSHLIGIELLCQGATVPDSAPAKDHVRNALGSMNEVFVDARRHVPGGRVLDEFRVVTRNSLARLRSLTESEWSSVVWSPEGPRPQSRFQEIRAFDSWVHLQDIRDALLEPTDDHGPGEEITLNIFESSMPYVWAKRVNAPDGAVVLINLTGRLARSVQIEMAQGWAVAREPTGVVPTVEVTTPVALFWRRCAGRISAEAFLAASATDCRGDLSLATALAEAMVVTP